MVEPKHARLIGSILLTIAALLILSLSLSSCSSQETNSANSGSGVGLPTPEPPKYTSASQIQPLSIDQVFEKQNLPDYNLDPARIRTIIATGDVIPGRMSNWQMVHKNNFRYPFEATVEYLNNADLTLINLESPLVKGCQATMEGMVFCGDQRFTDGLTYAGIDVADLANNHSDNYGLDGAEQTIEVLKGSNIDVIGNGNSLIKDIKGLRFGFLAYNGVGPNFDKEAIAKDITSLRPNVDVLVVAMHWGKEYVSVPEVSPGIADDDPRQMARLVIDAGADLIVGNHPHWVQGIEFYKDKLITYAHGNFVFDQNWSQETMEGVVGKYVFYDDKLLSVEFTPVVIEDYVQPHFALEAVGQAILDRMETASREMLGKGQ